MTQQGQNVEYNKHNVDTITTVYQKMNLATQQAISTTLVVPVLFGLGWRDRQ